MFLFQIPVLQLYWKRGNINQPLRRQICYAMLCHSHPNAFQYFYNYSLFPDPTFISPTSLPNPRNSTLERMQPKGKLEYLRQLLAQPYTTPPDHYQHQHTLAILNSLKTPLPFPPSIHLFLICVDLV